MAAAKKAAAKKAAAKKPAKKAAAKKKQPSLFTNTFFRCNGTLSDFHSGKVGLIFIVIKKNLGGTTLEYIL